MVWHPQAGSDYINPEICGDVKNWNCYFQQISNCTPYTPSHSSTSLPASVNTTNGTSIARTRKAVIRGTYRINATSIVRPKPVAVGSTFSLAFNEELKYNPPADLRALFVDNRHFGDFVPTVFVKALQIHSPGMTAYEMKYWWRAQGIAFLMRLNADTLTGVWALRQKKLATTASKPAQTPSLDTSGSDFLPLPRGTISAHVRHGDKYTEMELMPWSSYFTAAQGLGSRHPLGVSPNIFVSTDDPGVIDEAIATTAGTAWRAIYSSITRISTRETGVKPLLDLAGNLVHLHLLQLLMALEADAWVGTRGSNINRMIDELRCIWVPKCQFPYVEVGKYDEEFGWR